MDIIFLETLMEVLQNTNFFLGMVSCQYLDLSTFVATFDHSLWYEILDAACWSHYPKSPMGTLARLVLDQINYFFPSYWSTNGKEECPGVAQQL